MMLTKYPCKSYLIGLWFSLRTHASQIWQNPRQLLHAVELPPQGRVSLYNKILHPGQLFQPGQTASTNPTSQHTFLHQKQSNIPASNVLSHMETPLPREGSGSSTQPASAPQTSGDRSLQGSPLFQRRVSYAVTPNFLPVMESVNHVVKNTDLSSIKLTEPMSTDDFTRAVAVATVSALRHQQVHGQGRARVHSEHDAAAAGHDAPSWSRFTSASVLLGCTFLYALIAGMVHFMKRRYMQTNLIFASRAPCGCR